MSRLVVVVVVAVVCLFGCGPQSADRSPEPSPSVGGVEATLTEGVDAIIERLAAEARPDDVVLILSNGGFGGIYERLPAALEG